MKPTSFSWHRGLYRVEYHEGFGEVLVQSWEVMCGNVAYGSYSTQQEAQNECDRLNKESNE